MFKISKLFLKVKEKTFNYLNFLQKALECLDLFWKDFFTWIKEITVCAVA